MFEKLKMFTWKKILQAKSFALDLKNDEKGLSGIVVAVLLILVAVLAIAILNTSLRQWITDMWDKIVQNSNEF